MKARIKLSNEEIKELLKIESIEFPKYISQILNLANKNAQGTRPRVVGQMTELIKEFSGGSLEEWENWYLERHPTAIKEATEKIFQMVQLLKAAATRLIEPWSKAGFGTWSS